MAAVAPLKVKIILALILVLAVFSLFIFFNFPDEISEPLADNCLSCHSEEKSMSASHPVETFGCASCHLGNAFAADKENAHAGMVRNPSDLLWAEKTCGQSSCHHKLTEYVQTSIMASNTGLVTSTLLQWHESSVWNDSLQNIDGGFPDSSLATSHIRKLCAGCHINKRENDFPGEIGTRGGGCNDCHLVAAETEDEHPLFTVQIDIATCEKCHNRSNRTALNYQGKFESEGYGTPFESGNPSNDTLSGGRYFYHLPADVHFEAGMVCIDCHTIEDVMGDGKRYSHLEEQVHISCADCHKASFSKPDTSNEIWKIIQVNKNLVIANDSLFATTSRKTHFANVIRDNGVKLIRKMDGKKINITQIENKKSCNLKGHERLSCQSCHTPYSPQCYGCHDTYDPDKTQLDKITYEETKGHWSEGRSYLRFEEPALMLDERGRVLPAAPGCQVYMTNLEDSTQKFWPTIAAFDPHITRKQTVECMDCHSSAKIVGLGQGSYRLKDGKFEMSSLYNSKQSGLGEFPLGRIENENGIAVQRMSRETERPFNKKELERILSVQLCIVCHDSYEDKIYLDFKESVKRYFNEKSLPCRNENE